MTEHILNHNSILIFGKLCQNSFALVQALEGAGHSVTLTESLEEMIETTNSTPPHLIIFDLQTNAKEARLLIKAAHRLKFLPYFQIILLDPSGPSPSRKLEVEGIGSMYILSKNIRIHVLTEEIRAVLKSRVFPSIEFHPNSRPAIHVQLKCEIVSTNSNGLILRAPIKIVTGSIIQIFSKALIRLGLASCIFQKSPIAAQPAGNQTFFNEVSVVGIKPSTAHQLQRLVKIQSTLGDYVQ